MAPAERADAIDRAFRERKFWSSAALGNALSLTWEEHDDCEITAIRPARATDAEMAAVRKMKNTAAKREARKQEAPKPKKEPLPAIRAKIIADLLRPGERRTVKDLCKAVKKLARFKNLRRDRPGEPPLKNRLKAAVHEAIKFGVAHGMLLKQIEPGPVALITKINDTEQDRGAGCGQENPTVGKTCPQVRVLIIEEGLSTGGVEAGPASEDEDWFTGEWEGSDPDGGRVALSAPRP